MEQRSDPVRTDQVKGTPNSSRLVLIGHVYNIPTGHVYNIPTMQFFTGFSRNTQSKSYVLSLTECVWESRNDTLWETH